MPNTPFHFIEHGLCHQNRLITPALLVPSRGGVGHASRWGT
jgi:hypothetical protein